MWKTISLALPTSVQSVSAKVMPSRPDTGEPWMYQAEMVITCQSFIHEEHATIQP